PALRRGLAIARASRLLRPKEDRPADEIAPAHNPEIAPVERLRAVHQQEYLAVAQHPAAAPPRHRAPGSVGPPAHGRGAAVDPDQPSRRAHPVPVRRGNTLPPGDARRHIPSPQSTDGGSLPGGMAGLLMPPALRPAVEVVDMVAYVAAVPAEARPLVGPAHLLELARAEAQIESRLLGVKERAALLRARRSGNLVVHDHAAPRCPTHLEGISAKRARRRRGSKAQSCKNEPPGRVRQAASASCTSSSPGSRSMIAAALRSPRSPGAAPGQRSIARSTVVRTSRAIQRGSTRRKDAIRSK